MCELFGLSSKKEYDTTRILKAFFSHADENPHGWGLANIKAEKALIVKEPVSALKSKRIGEMLSHGIESRLLLGHIRYATKGSVSLVNTHPFKMCDRFGNAWVLVHNGTIFDCDALSRYSKVQLGETDSERILYYLTEMIDAEGQAPEVVDAESQTPDMIYAEGQAPDADRKIELVEGIIKNIVRENKVNIMISDGSMLYIHSNFRGSMYYLQRDGVAMAASRKLEVAPKQDQHKEALDEEAPEDREKEALDEEAPEDHETQSDCNVLEDISADDWQEVPLNTLLVFRDGELIYKGIAHNDEFFFDEEKMRMLFLDYAEM